LEGLKGGVSVTPALSETKAILARFVTYVDAFAKPRRQRKSHAIKVERCGVEQAAARRGQARAGVDVRH
jgi:hypothetical protein